MLLKTAKGENNETTSEVKFHYKGPTGVHIQKQISAVH